MALGGHFDRNLPMRWSGESHFSAPLDADRERSLNRSEIHDVVFYYAPVEIDSKAVNVILGGGAIAKFLFLLYMRNICDAKSSNLRFPK